MKKIVKIKKPVIYYTIIVLLLWSFIISASAWWNVKIEKNITIETVTNIAQSSFNKDQAYRQWASSHGGVYVEPTSKTPPNSFMAHIKDRDVVTTSGKELTLLSPAYMLKQMMADYSSLYGIKGRIVGTVYLNVENEADNWEAEAIKSFENGTKEILEFSKMEDGEYLRLMKPMIMRQKCQKCHGHLGFKNGDVRGGVSVSIPMKEHRKNEFESIQNIIITYFIIWIIGLVGIIITSITTIKYLNNREKDLEEIVISSQVFNNTLDAIFITDSTGSILRINKAFSDLTGYSEDEAIGKNARILKSTYHDKGFFEELWKDILKDGFTQVEIWNRDKSGEIFVSIESISSLKDEDDNIRYFIATLHDITARKNAEERILHMAHYDPLTDLPNRVLFQDRFLHAINVANREKQKVALAFIDIDGFKKVNDTKGHPTGDKLLIEVAKIIGLSIRKSDTLARLGGDEFTIVFENLDNIDKILPICKKILNSLRDEIVINNQSIFISASMGISIYPSDGEDIHTLIQHADTAMYKAKEDGKNRFNFYEESMTLRAKERVEIETLIQSAIKNDELTVYYQPKILASTKELVGMEALVRWISPTKGMIPPDKFIPIAEEMHIVDKIDLFVLNRVCEDMQTWKEFGYDDIKVAVNLSGYDIGTTNLFEKIVTILETHKVEVRNIELEITETYFVEFEQENLNVLNRLRDYGFQFSIDDFGTGYSSLSNIQKLPIDIVKIDQSFVKTMDENSDSQKLVDMIINLAHTLSLKTIAEGVETSYQFEYLKSKSCDYIQGYLESKPLPKDEFIKYLNSK